MNSIRVLVGALLSVGVALGHDGVLRDPSGRLPAMPFEFPRDVHSVLIDNGVIPDPYYGTNELLTTWVGNQDWIIEYDLVADAKSCACKRQMLRLEDVDTLAEISLNGKRLGETHNRFRRWEFDVTGLVRPGKNVLRGHFKNVIAAKEAAAAGYDHGYWVHGPVMKNLNLIRKPFCHGGWDWGPEIMNVGFMKKPELIATDGIIVDYVNADQHFADDLSRVDIDFTVAYSRADGSKAVWQERRTVEKPRLWWPQGMGEPAMTEFVLTVEGVEIRKRLGLRKLELLTEKDQVGTSMCFCINGRRFFAKGADFIPCDALESRQAPERYRDLVESAAAANMNMLRVWGGGQYERECFYDLCDEKGILVWQDFMFACACYPGTDKFLSEIDAEARHQIRRLKDHPCIAIWCGDNECGIGHANWYRKEIKTQAERDRLADEYRRRLAVLRRACFELDPTRAFWNTSPCQGKDKDPVLGGTSDNAGDEHNWDVWHGDQDFEMYRRRVPRFCSEFGYQSLSSPFVASTYLPPGPVDLDSAEFQHHQKDYGGNRRIAGMVGRYFKVPTDPVDFMWISQVQQGLAIKTAIECWRSSQPHCMGTLIWQLNDNWPVASWSSVEYGGRWKVMHHLAKRFYAPVTVQAVPVGETLEIRGVSDRGERKGVLTLTTYDFEGRIIDRIHRDCVIPEGAAVLLVKPLASWGDAETRKNRFLVLSFDDQEFPCTNDYLFCRPKDCAMKPADVQWRDGCLVTDRPAFFVITEDPDRSEGNCHTLLPDNPLRTRTKPVYWYNRRERNSGD